MEISHEILINSTIEEIWNKTIDFNNWLTWNPNIKSSKTNGEVKVGNSFELVQPGMGTVTWEIKTLDPLKSCSWATEHNGDILIATHRLSNVNSKVLNYIELEIQSTGFKKLFHTLLKPLYKLALIKENRGLKISLEN